MARILLEKYFFNRNVPIGTGYTRTNMEWKMRKDHSVMENRSEREGSKINPCSITHFPALAALQDQPNVVLSMDVSSKGSRNKILLQLCQATLKKKKRFGNHSDNTLEDARFQESRKHRAEDSASTSFLCCVSSTDQTRRYSRDISE